MNSFYGVLGTPRCRFYSPETANAITSLGQKILRWTRDTLEKRGHPVLYGDTDSLFVDLGTWFRALDGSLVDPQSANNGGSNEGLVNENVKRSLETFEDEDHDGSDDHGGLDGAAAAL